MPIERVNYTQVEADAAKEIANMIQVPAADPAHSVDALFYLMPNSCFH